MNNQSQVGWESLTEQPAHGFSIGVGPIGERKYWETAEILRNWEELWHQLVKVSFRNEDQDDNGHRYADRWDYGVTSSRNLENNTALTGCAACISTQVGRSTCRRASHSNNN